MTQPIVSVVLGTFNQCDVLEKVLEGYNHQRFPKDKFEVIVIDSSSTDDTETLFKTFKAQYSFRPYIQENQGKTAARNRGLNEAYADIIIITDADMIPDPQLIERHVQAHEKATVPTCFEGVTLNMHTLEWPTTPQNVYPYIRESLKDNQMLGFWYFLTGNISFPKRLILGEGGFSEDFLGYGWEDLELGYRLSKKKVPLRFLKHAVNYHYHVVTKDEEIDRNIKKGESAQIFLKKHPELKWFLGLNPLSRFCFPRISQNSRLFKWFSEAYQSPTKWKHELGFWFLKEYFYLKGLLNY